MLTTTLQGRLGNQFYSLSMLLAQAKKQGLPYHIPNRAYHCDGSKVYFPTLSTGTELNGLKEYHELKVHASKKVDGTYDYNTPEYRDIPEGDNIKYVGYWQSFKYFDWCKDYILEKFQVPYLPTKRVGIHIRRGDFLQLTDKHPSIPLQYYYTAITYFQELGYEDFVVFSDDINWCKENLVLSSANLFYQEGQTEYNDLCCLSSCTHQILCYSTFGFVAAWLNKNTDKKVIIPPRRYVFSGSNKDFIPDYFTELEF